MDTMMNVLRALNDETRLRISLLLHKEPLCVCEISDILELPQPKVSKHLAKLKDLNLVTSQRQEQFMMYYPNAQNTLFKSLCDTIVQHSDLNDQLVIDQDRLTRKEEIYCALSRQTRLGALTR